MGAGLKSGTRTTCPYCGVGCGVLVSEKSESTIPENTIMVSGDRDHPANEGRLCSKGSSLDETIGLEDRLLYPEFDGRRVSWNFALDKVADGFRSILAESGPEAVAFYVSGQLLTEDYYVANKLMKGFIGSGNIDTNSRLCMSSAVAAHKRAFGSDTVPGCYEDLFLANLVVLTGSNLAWCHPILFRRLAYMKDLHPERRLVVIDPRRTASCDIADLHLPIRPGSDAYLFNGLLVYLADTGHLNENYIHQHTEGFENALLAARASASSISIVAAACGLPEGNIRTFYEWFAEQERTVTVFSQGINQSSSGTDKGNAIINCHLAAGRIGQPGMMPFSITGQPNAMGGREVGGLANQLAAHMDFTLPENIRRVERFWHAPRIATKEGLKAVDMFQAIAEKRIKAIWIMATNPAVTLPDADFVRSALKACPLVVVSDCMHRTDTTVLADILLPALAWGEKDGTVTNSERCISRQRAFLPPPGQAKPDWWIVCEVAKRLGYGDAFAYESPADIFREHAALSDFENNGQRDFNIGSLAQLTNPEYETLNPIQWPVRSSPDGGHKGTSRMFSDGQFFTPSGRARFVAIVPRLPVGINCTEYPFILNTGRIRDQWHTMTRTGKSGRLSAHTPEPVAEIHPEDAERMHIQEDGLVKISSAQGTIVVRAQLTHNQQPGQVFVPMHWNDQFASCARVDALVQAITDPMSGQPESKQTPVRLEIFQPAWQGFALSREAVSATDPDYWVRNRGQAYWRTELACSDIPAHYGTWGRRLLNHASGEWLEFMDIAAGRYRAACLAEGQLVACLFMGPQLPACDREWLAGLFEKELDESARCALLSGYPPQGGSSAGRIICTCFGVGINTILDVIQVNSLTSLEELFEHMRAGTNCGSCIPELRSLLTRQ